MQSNQRINYTALWRHVLKTTTVPLDSIHGPAHWLRVERNGLYLARQTGADKIVVRLFALFHDCQRLTDSEDKGHGLRGAEYAKQLRNSLLQIDDELFDCLYQACSGHTDQLYSENPTIATCWDADRLELGRAGIKPDPKFLNTETAKKIARTSAFSCLEEIPLRAGV